MTKYRGKIVDCWRVKGKLLALIVIMICISGVVQDHTHQLNQNESFLRAIERKQTEK